MNTKQLTQKERLAAGLARTRAAPAPSAGGQDEFRAAMFREKRIIKVMLKQGVSYHHAAKRVDAV